MKPIKYSSTSSGLLTAIGTFYVTGYAIGTIYGLLKRKKANYGTYLGNKTVVGGLIGLGIMNVFQKKNYLRK